MEPRRHETDDVRQQITVGPDTYWFSHWRVVSDVAVACDLGHSSYSAASASRIVVHRGAGLVTVEDAYEEDGSACFYANEVPGLIQLLEEAARLASGASVEEVCGE